MQRLVCGIEVAVRGQLLRTASLLNEGYDFINDPASFFTALAKTDSRIDLLTFVQPIAQPKPIYTFDCELDQLAVLPIHTYEDWWKKQINDKTRNMVRRASKKGVAIREFHLDEQAARSIKTIYDESPIRQGKPFKHYGKDLETIYKEHITFVDRSRFIGAFVGEQLIGFVKLVRQPGWASMMQIISLISHRDKSPTNALIARSVEICAETKTPLLQYGMWSRRGIGEFKEHHGFRSYAVPRYYVPLSRTGRIALTLGMNKSIRSRIPERYVDRMISVRAAWNTFKLNIK